LLALTLAFFAMGLMLSSLLLIALGLAALFGLAFAAGEHDPGDGHGEPGQRVGGRGVGSYYPSEPGGSPDWSDGFDGD
jgi:hypothetical protein